MTRGAHRLALLGHRLVWWSPLACSPGYRPVTQGMQARAPEPRRALRCPRPRFRARGGASPAGDGRGPSARGRPGMDGGGVIVDAHHHVWRRADLPWLNGPMVPRIFGPYEPICRDYPIEEYLADIAGTGVEASVYVQANWPIAAIPRRGALGAGGPRADGLAERDRRLRRPVRSRRRTHVRGPAGGLAADAGHPPPAALARERAVPLRRRAGPDERPGAARERREARRARLGVRAPGLHGPDGGRGTLRRRVAGGDVRPPARRDAREHGRRARGAVAARARPARRAAEPHRQAERPGHVRAPCRPRADRARRALEPRALRLRAVHVRQQLPDREAVDRLRDRCSPRGRARSPPSPTPCAGTSSTATARRVYRMELPHDHEPHRARAACDRVRARADRGRPGIRPRRAREPRRGRADRARERDADRRPRADRGGGAGGRLRAAGRQRRRRERTRTRPSASRSSSSGTAAPTC